MTTHHDHFIRRSREFRIVIALPSSHGEKKAARLLPPPLRLVSPEYEPMDEPLKKGSGVFSGFKNIDKKMPEKTPDPFFNGLLWSGNGRLVADEYLGFLFINNDSGSHHDHEALPIAAISGIGEEAVKVRYFS